MEFLRRLTLFINDFFLYYIIIYGSILFISAVVGSFVFYFRERRKKYKNEIERKFYLPVSIIVPAYNEEVTIISTINSLLKLDYKLYEIIVVDDGSSDSTLNKVIEYYNLKPVKKVVRKKIKTEKIKAYYEGNIKVKLTLVAKENGGKADALNAGINISSFPYFLTIDADSILQKDSLTEIVKPIIENSNTIAVGGVIKLSNNVVIQNGNVVEYKLPHGYLEMIQTLEYDRTFLAGRTVFDLFNGNLIISGAFGLFHKQKVIEIGGYKRNTVGEDMELVIRLHDYAISNKMDYAVKYATDAICYTQAPKTLRDFKKQRRRWHTGLFQSLTTHKNMLLNPKYKALGLLSFPYYWVYELLAPLTETIGLIFIIISYFLELINLRFMIIYLATYIMFCTIFTVTTFFNRTYTKNYQISLASFIKVLFYSFIENFGFRQLVNIYRLEAFFLYHKNKLKWGKIQREEVVE